MTGLDSGYRCEPWAATSSERNFVLRSWVRGSRMTSEGMRCPRERWYASQHDIASEILGRGALVLVARDSEEPAFLHGFIVAERVGAGLVVHWVSVKRDSRGYGVARALLDEAVEQLASGAERLLYSHDARFLVEGYEGDGRRKLMPALWLERKLRGMGFRRCAVETLVGGREVA